MVGNRKYRFIEHRTTYNLVQLILINIVFTVAVTFRGSIVDYDGYPVETLSRITPQASTFDGFMAVISFTLYPAYISSVVIVGFEKQRKVGYRLINHHDKGNFKTYNLQ